MRWLRGALFADPMAILSTIVLGSLSVFVSLFETTGRLQMRVARVWARTLLVAGGIHVSVEGLEHIHPDGSYVFIANHLSYMDTPVVLASIPVEFRFLAKRGLFQIPFLGSHLSRAGHVPVAREDPRAAVKTMQQAAQVIQDKKVSLLVFPEGGRSHDGVLGPFKEGGAYIGIRAGAPLVPVVLIGTRDVLPYGGGVIRSGSVTLRILKPIETAGLALKDRSRLMEEVRDLIYSELPPEGRLTQAYSC